MQTRRLYYEDSHVKTFEGVVLSCSRTENGWEVVLDATAFYPTGGGQPCDTGVLGQSAVISVYEVGEQVVHLCREPLTVGSRVTGSIDWERRFDFMQQHSGEHMVSGVIHRRYGWHNVGFHMGADVVTIDFDGPIPAGELQQIEAQVNAAVWEDISVVCSYPSQEALPTIPYRRKKDLPWPVRLVEIPGIDLCACCGTQVKHTGEVGLVKLLSCVKFHDGVRIEMACGKRALDLLSATYEQNKLVSQTLSAKPEQTGLAACRLQEALGAEKYRAAGLERRLFGYIAQGYAGRFLGLHFEESLQPDANRELCDTMAAVCTVAVALSGTDEAGYSLCIISRAADVKAIGTCAVQALQGRGGGRREVFQGSVRASRREIEDYFAAVTENNLLDV